MNRRRVDSIIWHLLMEIYQLNLEADDFDADDEYRKEMGSIANEITKCRERLLKLTVEEA